jgi:hypothetical protein
MYSNDGVPAMFGRATAGWVPTLATIRYGGGGVQNREQNVDPASP